MTQTLTPRPQRAAKPATAPLKMSFEEFLQWADEDTHAEWVDGEVIFMSPVSDDHSDLNTFLASLLRVWTEDRQPGIVRCDPFLMKTGPKLPGRQPDILVLLRENQSRLRTNYLDGPADLVVEIISPESRSRDRVKKLREYQRGGVREYWLLDPMRRSAQFYQLSAGSAYAGSAYQEVAPDNQGIYHSAVLPALWLRVDWLWQKPLPRVLDVLKQWSLI